MSKLKYKDLTMQNVIVKHFLDMLTFEKSNFLVLCLAKPRIFVFAKRVHVTNYTIYLRSRYDFLMAVGLLPQWSSVFRVEWKQTVSLGVANTKRSEASNFIISTNQIMVQITTLWVLAESALVLHRTSSNSISLLLYKKTTGILRGVWIELDCGTDYEKCL